MKKIIHYAVLALFCTMSLGAQAAEKDGKDVKDAKATTKASTVSKAPATPMEELNYKYEKLVQLSYQRHNEVMKMLKDIREQTNQKTLATAPVATPEVTTPAEASKVQAAPASITVAQDEQGRNVAAATATPSDESKESKSTPAPAVEVAAAVVATTTTPPATSTETPTAPEAAAPSAINVVNAPAAEAPSAMPIAAAASPEPQQLPQEATPEVVSAAPAEPTAAVKVELPEEFTKGIASEIGSAKSFGILAFLVSLVSLVSMGFLIVNVRKSDEKIRRMLWKNEVDHLREEVIGNNGGRPQLKVEKSFDRLILTNVGTVIADEIKLSLGPAPRTMKQRLRVLARIEANEKAEVDIGPQQATDGQIYGTLEYRNCETGKLFKEQFILKVDSVTGELIPVQQAV